MKRLAAYRKSIFAFVGSTLLWVGTAYVPDGHVDRFEWYGLAVGLATTFGVYTVTNEPAIADEPEPTIASGFGTGTFGTVAKDS